MSHDVVWETEDGKWYRSTFLLKNGSTDYDHFGWVSGDHESKAAAIYSGGEDNPYTTVYYSGNENQIKEYQSMVHEYYSHQLV